MWYGCGDRVVADEVNPIPRSCVSEWNLDTSGCSLYVLNVTTNPLIIRTDLITIGLKFPGFELEACISPEQGNEFNHGSSAELRKDGKRSSPTRSASVQW